MAHIRQRLAQAVEKGAVRREMLEFETERTAGGRELRNQLWDDFLNSYDVSWPIGPRGAAFRTEIKAAFRASKAGMHTFDFRDWDDYEIADEVIGIGDGAETVFPLIITDTFGSQSHSRRIFLPEVTSFVLKVDGVVQPSGFTLDADTGVVTFAVAPAIAEPVSWSGRYDKPVRFDGELSSNATAIALEKFDQVTLYEMRL